MKQFKSGMIVKFNELEYNNFSVGKRDINTLADLKNYPSYKLNTIFIVEVRSYNHGRKVILHPMNELGSNCCYWSNSTVLDEGQFEIISDIKEPKLFKLVRE